jgi:hypothetical protein
LGGELEIGIVGLVGAAIGGGLELGGGITTGGGLMTGGDIGGENGGYPGAANSARPSSDSTEIVVFLFTRRAGAGLWLNG